MSDVCYKSIRKSINYKTMIYKIAQFFLITFAYDISTQKNSFQLYGMTSCVREISFLFRMQKFQQQSVFRNILWRWYKYKARVIGHLKQSIHGCWHNHNQSIKQRFSSKNTVSESSMDRLQSSLSVDGVAVVFLAKIVLEVGMPSNLWALIDCHLICNNIADMRNTTVYRLFQVNYWDYLDWKKCMSFCMMMLWATWLSVNW